MKKLVCVYTPKKGKNLFNSLKKDFDYETARDLFLLAMTPKFQNIYKNSLIIDIEGVPSKKSFLSIPYVQNKIKSEKVIESLSKKSELSDNTIANYQLLVEEAFRFNNDSEYSNMVTAIIDQKDNKIYIKYIPKSDENLNYFRKQYGGFNLYQKLSQILKESNINIEDLDEQSINNGRVGIIDFNKAVDTAEGFVSLIKRANNIEGVKALSEEFSHLIIRISAKKEHPIVLRAIESLQNDEKSLRTVLGDQYEDTVKFHNGNMKLVAEEALGQILRDNLIEENTIQNFKHKTLFRRVIDFIKNLFKNVNYRKIQDAIVDANFAMNDMAKAILKGKITLTKEEILETRENLKFNSLSETIQTNIDILKEALQVEVKRAEINHGNKTETRNTITSLKKELKNDNSDRVLGILNYAEYALNSLNRLRGVYNRLEDLTLGERFALYRNTRNYIQSYATFIDNINETLNTTKEEDAFVYDVQNELEVSLKDIIKDLIEQQKSLSNLYMKNAMKDFSTFLQDYLGQTFTIKDQKVSLEDLVKKADSDISFLDRWIDSMGESSDVLLQSIDAVTKIHKDISRENTIEFSKKVFVWLNKAEKQGITNFEYFFEVDDEGHKTGNYVSEINTGQYYKDLRKMEEDLDAKYGKNPSGDQAQLKIAERQKWHNIHSVGTDPNPIFYRNEKYHNLSDTQKQILNDYIDLKIELDQNYPENKVSNFKAIQVRKTKEQRIIDAATSPSTLFQEIKKSVISTFADVVDDDQQFGTGQKRSLSDFSGKEYMVLPVLFTTRLENPDELSTDVTSALLQYAYSSLEYKELDKLVNPLEVGRFLINEARKVQQTRGSSQVVEKLSAYGIQITNNINVLNSNISARMEDFMESQIYHRYIKDEGTIGNTNINTAKSVNWLLKVSSVAQLGFNWLADIANVTTTTCMQRIEGAAGEYFTNKELVKADAEYAKLIGSYVTQLTSRVKDNKLYLFEELFNTTQDFKKGLEGNKKKNYLERLFGANLAFLGQSAGNHWLYNRVAIAYCMHIRVNVPGKSSMSLWDALEIKEHPDDPSVKQMIIPDNTVYEGTSDLVTMSDISRRIAHINHSLAGIYNDEDANAAHRVALGRLLMQYRKWMKPQFNKRFQARQYNVIMGKEEEGYYRTLFRIINELYRGQVQLGMLSDQLDDFEKYNIRRALFEIIQFLFVSAIVRFVNFGDREKRPYALKLAEYIAQRSKHELGNLVPGLSMAKGLHKTVQQPFAVSSVISSSIDLLQSIASPMEDWNDELQSGPYKGHSTLYKNFMKAPIPIVSHYKQLDRFFTDIDTSIDFYIRSK